MQSLVFTPATQFARRETADDKARKMDTDGRDRAPFQLGGAGFPGCGLVAYDA